MSKPLTESQKRGMRKFHLRVARALEAAGNHDLSKQAKRAAEKPCYRPSQGAS